MFRRAMGGGGTDLECREDIITGELYIRYTGGGEAAQGHTHHKEHLNTQSAMQYKDHYPISRQSGGVQP